MLLVSKVSLLLLCSFFHTVQTLQNNTKSPLFVHLDNTSPQSYDTLPIKYLKEDFKPRRLIDQLLRHSADSFETTTAKAEDMAYLAAIEVSFMDGGNNMSFTIVGKLSGFIDPEPITGLY